MWRVGAAFFALFVGLPAILVIFKGEFTGGFGPKGAENPTRITRRDNPLKFWTFVAILLAIAAYLANMAWTGWPFE